MAVGGIAIGRLTIMLFLVLIGNGLNLLIVVGAEGDLLTDESYNVSLTWGILLVIYSPIYLVFGLAFWIGARKGRPRLMLPLVILFHFAVVLDIILGSVMCVVNAPAGAVVIIVGGAFHVYLLLMSHSAYIKFQKEAEAPPA